MIFDNLNELVELFERRNNLRNQIENRVIVKDIMGRSREFENSKITEINVTKELLILSPISAQKQKN